MTSIQTVPNSLNATQGNRTTVARTPLEQQRAWVRKSHRKRREQLRIAKLCLDCGASRRTGHALCQSCLLARSTREAARRTRLKAVTA